MSIKTGIAVAAALCALLGLTGGAGAEMLAPSQTPKAAKSPKSKAGFPPLPKTINIVGCAYKDDWTEWCTLIKAPNGYTYSVITRPAVPIGKLISLQADVMGYGGPDCDGIVTENVKWRLLRGRCMGPKPPRK